MEFISLMPYRIYNIINTTTRVRARAYALYMYFIFPLLIHILFCEPLGKGSEPLGKGFEGLNIVCSQDLNTDFKKLIYRSDQYTNFTFSIRPIRFSAISQGFRSLPVFGFTLVNGFEGLPKGSKGFGKG